MRHPRSVVGKALAEFLNAHPTHMLDYDLARFKSVKEQGKTSAHHHKIRLDEVTTAN